MIATNQIIGRVAATKQQGNNSREFYFWIDPSVQINPLDLIVVREADSPEESHQQVTSRDPIVAEQAEAQQESHQQVTSQDPIVAEQAEAQQESQPQSTSQDPIVVEQAKSPRESQQPVREVYAQVLDITSHTDAESFLEVFASTDFGNVQLSSSVERVAFSVAKAQVLGTSDGIRMPVRFNSPVYLMDEKAILGLLKVGELEERYRLPVGYIEQSNGVRVPISMDVRWLTGPDGAHLNVSGKTRLAAKTSYALFLVSSLLQTQEDTAVIIFNVKGSDLLQVHQLSRQLTDDDESVWKTLGLKPEAFDKDKVFYFLPSQRNDIDRVNSDPRNLPDPSDDQITKQPRNYYVYRYFLENVRGKLRLLLASQHPSDAQQQFIDALDNDTNSYAYHANSFEELCRKLQGHLPSSPSSQGTNYLNSSPSTIGVVLRLIRNLTHNRTTGVFDYFRSTIGDPRWRLPSDFIRRELNAGHLMVVDIARVNDYEQQWVFADVLKAVEDLMVSRRSDDEGGVPPPKKVVVFVDELNKYAPAGESSPLIQDIIDITARGGSLGVILFGAEQFASRIHPQVYGNCANKAFGLTDATEANTDPYRSFPREIRDRLTELQRGELVISFDFFGQPLRIKFPRPVCRKQEDAT